MNLFKSWLVETFIAHRGLHDKEAPENSLMAFKKAKDNFYAVELDVQLLSDGTVAVFHDKTLSRMTGKDGFISALKRDDLKEYKLLGTKEHIPTLEEAFNLIGGEVPILIEIKNTNKVGELEAAVLSLIRQYSGEVAILSFNPIVVGWFKDNAPDIIRGQLGGALRHKKISLLQRAATKRMPLNRLTKPHFIAYEASALPNRFVKKYSKIPLIAWTVQSQEEFLRIVKFSDNIMFEGFEPKI